MRPTLYKSAQKVGPGLYDNPDSFLIISNKMGDYIDTSKGLKVCVSSWRRNSDNAIPPRAKVADVYKRQEYIQTIKVVKNKMAEVKVGENESIESALRRFKKKIQKAGILSEVKKRERYEKPSVKRKRKSEAARKRKV